MDKPRNALKSNFSLRKPVSSLLKKRAVRALGTKEISAPNPTMLIKRMFTDKKPDPKKAAERPLVTKGVSVAKLMSKTRQQQKDLSVSVVLKNVQRLYHKKTMNPVVVAETYSKKTGKEATGYDKYVTFVEGLNTSRGKKFSETLVKVGCSCAFFLFFAEVALSKYNAAYVLFSNGKDPVVRNPKNTPLLCKHLVKLLNKIEEKKI